MKKGRISKDEERIIRRLVDSLTVEDIAKQLDRDVESVDNFIKRKLRVGITNEEAAAFSLESRPYWSELTSQFTGDELELFKYHWSRIIAQFKDDVFPTEELQVVDVIKLEILMNRCLKSNKDNLNEMNVIDQMIRDERALCELFAQSILHIGAGAQSGAGGSRYGPSGSGRRVEYVVAERDACDRRFVGAQCPRDSPIRCGQ